jgi:hypothetical protein
VVGESAGKLSVPIRYPASLITAVGHLAVKLHVLVHIRIYWWWRSVLTCHSPNPTKALLLPHCSTSHYSRSTLPPKNRATETLESFGAVASGYVVVLGGPANTRECGIRRSIINYMAVLVKPTLA